MKTKKSKERIWEVKRVVVEHYQVMASSRAEAILLAESPSKIFVRKETATPLT